MKRTTILRFFVISFIISLGLGFASFLGLRTLNESSISEVRKHMILYIVQIVEGTQYSESVQDYHFRRNGLSFGSDLWVLSGQGIVIASNSNAAIPIYWNTVKKPVNVHDFIFLYRPFRLVSDLTLVKLDKKETTYLLIGSRHQPSLGGPLWVQISFLFFVAGLAVLIAVIFLFTYFRKKSLEARIVLSRLEKGDLKARFDIKRVDEIGSLMVDFNRMASEIERLVYRIEETEKARKNLLEELSHDVRTPLTSLKMAIETLSEHLDEMPKEEQRDFLKIGQAELNYFLNLIDDLFFVADLGEPRYKKTARKVDLEILLQEEIAARQSQQKIPSSVASSLPKGKRIYWKLKKENTEGDEDGEILGDPLLLQRLIKNALDNAAKYTVASVVVKMHTKKESVILRIEDDGPGITDGAISKFGQRKKYRLSKMDRDYSISLGLGSVIMKTIVELHGGQIKIERLNQPQGTRLTLIIPKT